MDLHNLAPQLGSSCNNNNNKNYNNNKNETNDNNDKLSDPIYETRSQIFLRCESWDQALISILC